MKEQEKIRIGGRYVGEGMPCFVVAEAGVNHDGRIENAKKLIDAAAKAGADAVKFQTFKAEDVATGDAPLADYQKKAGGGSQLGMLKKLELKDGDFEGLADYCRRKNIIFMSTPHSKEAIDLLEGIVPAYKFGSGDMTNIPALEYAAKKGKPMILGTGMSTLEEARQAVEAILATGNNKIILLQCTTSYPCPPEDVNLRAMQTLQRELGCPVGFSDHTLGATAAIAAAALGAVIVEKHFTLDRRLPGPDHAASIEPEELKALVEGIREVEAMLGSDEKKPTEGEKKIMEVVRKSLVAAGDIKAGELIKEGMLVAKRPGTGISPARIKEVVGRKAKKEMRKDELLTWEALE